MTASNLTQKMKRHALLCSTTHQPQRNEHFQETGYLFADEATNELEASSQYVSSMTKETK